jgi:hypothetical protein
MSTTPAPASTSTMAPHEVSVSDDNETAAGTTRELKPPQWDYPRNWKCNSYIDDLNDEELTLLVRQMRLHPKFDDYVQTVSPQLDLDDAWVFGDTDGDPQADAQDFREYLMKLDAAGTTTSTVAVAVAAAEADTKTEESGFVAISAGPHDHVGAGAAPCTPPDSAPSPSGQAPCPHTARWNKLTGLFSWCEPLLFHSYNIHRRNSPSSNEGTPIPADAAHRHPMLDATTDPRLIFAHWVRNSNA